MSPRADTKFAARAANVCRRAIGLHYLADFKSLIEFMLSSPVHHVLVLSSPPGWAKTVSTKKILSNLGVKYQVLGAYSTPLALYNRLSEDSLSGPAAKPQVFVLDDTHGILGNPQALSILNAASWPSVDKNNERQVAWTSTSERASIPSFVFKGKILILTNYMTDLPQAQAFVSRALNCKVEITEEQIPDIFLEAASSREYFPDQNLAKKVARFVGEKAMLYKPGRISLRDLSRAYDMALHFQGDSWQTLFLKTLPGNVSTENLEDLVSRLHQSELKVKEQVRQFCLKTGLGELKFYYIRSELGLQSPEKSKAARSSKTRSKPTKAKRI